MAVPVKAFPQDPHEVLAINDAHRRPDVGGADLWTLEELRDLGPLGYHYPMPTFGHRFWTGGLALPSQEDYDATFAAKFPIAAKILGKVPGLVVAGGAAAYPLGHASAEPGDVDFFLDTGTLNLSGGERWKQAEEFTMAITRAARGERLQSFRGEHPRTEKIVTVLEVLTPGVFTITFHAGWGSTPTPKHQLILRGYASPGAAIHGFDIGSSCVFYDGKLTRMSTLGAYAHLFRVNIVSPKYRSLTYESRLAKYFNRGYALGLPDLNPARLREALETHRPLKLEHMTLTPATTRGNRATGELAVPPGPTASDYESTALKRVNRYMSPTIAFISDWNNLLELVRGTNRFAIYRTHPLKIKLDDWAQRRVYVGEGLDFLKFSEKEPALEDILPRPKVDKLLDSVTKSAGRGRKLSTARLRAYFGLTSEQIGHLSQVFTDFSLRHPNQTPDLAPALAPFRARTLAQWEAAARSKIEWWITEDPQRQYTASRDPRIESPAEWYGEENLARPGAPPPPLQEALLAALEDRLVPVDAGKVYDNTCAFCYGPARPGAANTAVLACGHSFHWTRSSECSGLWSWIEMEGSDSCPACRAPVDGSARRPKKKKPERVPLEVDWGSLLNPPATSAAPASPAAPTPASSPH